MSRTALLERLEDLRENDGYLSAEEIAVVAKGLSAEDREAIVEAIDVDDFETLEELEEAAKVLQVRPEELSPTDPEDRDDLRDRIWKFFQRELYKERSIDVADLDIGDFAGLKLQLTAQLLDPKDKLVAEHKFRSGQDGGDGAARWVLLGGGVFPSASAKVSIPAGPGTIKAGFSAKGSLGYSAIVPLPADVDEAADLVKAVTVDLPFTSEKAKDQAAGTEIVLRGTGRIVASAGYGVGLRLAELEVAGETVGSAALEASFGVRISGSRQVLIRYKRLGAARVFFSISTLSRARRREAVRLHAGLTTSAEDQLEDLGGKLIRRGLSLAGEEVDEQVKDWLRVDLSAVHRAATSEKEIANYVLDLSDPDAAEAYAGLVRLDTRRADELAGGASAAVRSAKLDESVRADRWDFNMSLGEIDLLSVISKATTNEGSLRGSGEEHIEYYRTRLDNEDTSKLHRLWYGERLLYRELVQIRREPTAGFTSYYCTVYAVKDDRRTGEPDIHRFLRLARFLGAVQKQAEPLLSNKSLAQRLRVTDMDLDVFLTDEGLDLLGRTPLEELQRAYAVAYEEIDRPYVGTAGDPQKQPPWLAKRPSRHVLGILNEAVRAPHANRRTRISEYTAATGRILDLDVQAFKESRELPGLFHEIGKESDPEQRAELLHKGNAVLDLDFWRELAMIAQVVGPERVLINHLSLVDRKREIEIIFMSEGALRDPRNALQRLLGLGA